MAAAAAFGSPPSDPIAQKQSRPKAALLASARSLLRSGAGGSGSSVRSSGGGTSGSGSGGIGSRGGGRRRSRGGSSSGSRSRRRLFLLAAGGQGNGGNHRGENERFLHFSFLLGIGTTIPECVLGCWPGDRGERLDAPPAQPIIIALSAFLPGYSASARQLGYRPSVLAGKAGVALRSHALSSSRTATRRSGSLPQ
jgi:hypothetical protein